MRETIKFEDMSKAEQQAFVDFQWKELNRHLDDIIQIRDDLQTAKLYGIEPRNIYVNKWIEVKSKQLDSNNS